MVAFTLRPSAGRSVPRSRRRHCRESHAIELPTTDFGHFLSATELSVHVRDLTGTLRLRVKSLTAITALSGIGKRDVAKHVAELKTTGGGNSDELLWAIGLSTLLSAGTLCLQMTRLALSAGSFVGTTASFMLMLARTQWPQRFLAICWPRSEIRQT